MELQTATLRVSAGRLVLPFLLGILELLVIWQLCSMVLPEYVIASPWATLQHFVARPEFYLSHLGVTLLEAGLGLSVAFLVATVTVLSAHMSTVFDRLSAPIFDVFQAFPKEALAPVFLLAFGLGVSSKVAMAAMISIFPLYVTLRDGLKKTPVEVERFYLSVRAPVLSILSRIRVFYAFPYLIAGLKLALPLAIIGAVIGEFLGASSGAGYLIKASYATYDVKTVFTSLAMLGTSGLMLALLAGVIQLSVEKTLRLNTKPWPIAGSTAGGES